MKFISRLLAAALLVSAAVAQSPKTLWVLQGPDEIAEYDVTKFAVRRTLKVPRRVIEHPEYLSVNARGQMVFLPPKDAQWASGEMASASGRMWFWDGQQAQERAIEGPRIPVLSAGKSVLTETAVQWFLSAGGKSLFWFENKFEKVTEESGLERSVRCTARVWRTAEAGGRPEAVASFPTSEWCTCTTGVCSESCPEWYTWAPDGLVGDFLLLTRFTQGQIGSTYHESFIYQRSGGTWQVKKLPRPVERPLTASPGGDVLVAALPDGGCCGWENDSSDQVLLLENGKVSVLYDEFERFNNRNYDVSFYPRDARLAGANATLAYTLVSTALPDGEIRLSLDGKENAGELARVRKAIAVLPAVEVLKLGTGPRLPLTTVIPHAELIGWLSGKEILVAQDGRLKVYDSGGVMLKETAIRVRSAADAFLR